MVQRIDVRNLVARKIYAGELNFEFEAEGELLEIPFVSFSTPVAATLRYEIFSDDSVEVKGQIAFSLKGSCSRCLAEAETRITYDVEGVFVTGEPADEEYGYSNGVIVLSEFLRDSVLFALPARHLCDACMKEE